MNEYRQEPEKSMELPKPSAKGELHLSNGEAFGGESGRVKGLETQQSTSSGFQPAQTLGSSLPQQNARDETSDAGASNTIMSPGDYIVPIAHDMPEEARDTDRIEGVWIEKLNEVIANHRNDPYAKTKELIRIKVDYMKKRYNKEIKLTKDD